MSKAEGSAYPVIGVIWEHPSYYPPYKQPKLKPYGGTPGNPIPYGSAPFGQDAYVALGPGEGVYGGDEYGGNLDGTVVPTQPPMPYENVTGLAPAVNPIPFNEQSARFHPGCGHAIMAWEIKRTSVGGVPSAILCCPQCSYVQDIYTPYSLIEQQDFIFG